jgi:hypothetical protein
MPKIEKNVLRVIFISVENTRKKTVRRGKDHPPGIILRRDRNMVPAEKNPNPGPHH